MEYIKENYVVSIEYSGAIGYFRNLDMIIYNDERFINIFFKDS